MKDEGDESKRKRCANKRKLSVKGRGGPWSGGRTEEEETGEDGVGQEC